MKVMLWIILGDWAQLICLLRVLDPELDMELLGWAKLRGVSTQRVSMTVTLISAQKREELEEEDNGACKNLDSLLGLLTTIQPQVSITQAVLELKLSILEVVEEGLLSNWEVELLEIHLQGIGLEDLELVMLEIDKALWEGLTMITKMMLSLTSVKVMLVV